MPTPDIGTWAFHEDALGTRFLKGDRASPDDVRAILRRLGATAYKTFARYDDVGLDERARGALMRHADSKQPAGEADLKLQLSRDELAAIVGDESAMRLDALFRQFGAEGYEVRVRPLPSL